MRVLALPDPSPAEDRVEVPAIQILAYGMSGDGSVGGDVENNSVKNNRKDRNMKKVLYGLIGVAMLTMAAVAGEGAQGKKSAEQVVLCGKCGQIKGAEVCCKADAPKCSKCGLAKGAPGCCKLPEAGKDVALCNKCGQIKGSDVCCKADAPKCSKCGLAKGAPGCCKLPKKQ